MSKVHQSTDYDKFSLIATNREISRGHVEALKRAFTEAGNLTAIQPILVNERMQIVDGQHRFTACMELGETIHYTEVKGLGIHEARSMNILHRNWLIDDYAKSYAESGDPNYQRYIDLKEDYGFGHTATMLYIVGAERKKQFAEFRRGEFTCTDDDIKLARVRLSRLADMEGLVDHYKRGYFIRALLKVMNAEGYDHKRMLKKLEAHPELVRQYGSTVDYVRMLEEIYNYKNAESNRVRFF